jgi:hypothetical protein
MPVAIRNPDGAAIWGTINDNILAPATTAAWIGHPEDAKAPT